MARKKYTVTVVNPRTRKKKRAAKKRNAKRPAKRTKKQTKATRKNPDMAKRKRTSRRRRPAARTAAPRRRRRTTRRSRSNPSRARRAASYARGKMSIDPMAPWGKDMLARIAGKVVSVWAVKRWGDALTTPTSGQTGGAWTFKNYLIALAAGYFAGEVGARVLSKPTGQQIYNGAAEFIATKITWSEVVMRWGWTQTQLGGVSDGYPSFAGVSDGYPSFAGGDDLQALMAQGQPGDMIDDGNGNRYLNQGGRWVAMMGLDGVVEAGPLGDVVEAGPLGSMVEAGPLGHMMSQSASRADERQGAYTFRGSKDPYRSSFM
jgi:hypothetical protein